MGVNVGAEVDGKNENFERPVLVVRVYNKETMLVLPITSKEKSDDFHYEIKIHAKNSETREEYTKSVWIKLTQARVISNNRLLRKVDIVHQEDFAKVVEAFRKYI
ncbi:MAG: type II toxin-antitoxin system PemK/MazF family toxin [bacterium]|nr:type II toxin-antitoxin system PemK/MazF family toxin [bacterium]